MTGVMADTCHERPSWVVPGHPKPERVALMVGDTVLDEIVEHAHAYLLRRQRRQRDRLHAAEDPRPP